jgi:hypothetical protein
MVARRTDQHVDGVINKIESLDRMRTPERPHGSFERIEIAASQLVKVDQIRGEKNVIATELKESIYNTGLINGIDVARMDHDALVEYIEFVNVTWNANSSIEDFVLYQQSDSMYYLVIAGHSRHAAILDLEREGRLLADWPLEVKVHTVSSPEDIIAIQLAENEHSQPPRERRATAIIETYEWGLHKGKWKTQAEFLKQEDHKVTKSFLSEALSYHNLPGDVRNYVLSGHLSYTAGVELGKAAYDTRKYLIAKARIDEATMSDEETALLDQALMIQMVVKTNHILNTRMNTSAAEKHIRAWRKQMVNEMALAAEVQDSDVTSLFDELEFDLFGADDLLRQDIERGRLAIAEFSREYARRPTSAAEAYIELNAEIIGGDITEKILADLKKASDAASRKIGSIVADKAGVDKPNGIDQDENLTWGVWNAPR